MFGELPKLFGRNFAMAYFLPTALVLILGIFTLDGYTTWNIGSWNLNDLGIGTTLAVLICWIGSVSLLVTNRELYRLMEGYGCFNPIRLFKPLEQRRYRQLLRAIEKAKAKKKEYRKKNEPVPAELQRLRNRLEQKLVEEFPSTSELLLPTAFGNTMRAFETYPSIMYGIEGVDGWDRLLGVIPQDYRSLIDDAKSQVDFWLNLGFLGLVLLIVNLYFVGTTHDLSAPLPFFLLVLTSVIAPQQARFAAAEWGSMVKSAFDLFLSDLREKVEMKEISSLDEERGHWVWFSEAIVYRLPKSIEKMKAKKQREKHTFE